MWLLPRNATLGLVLQTPSLLSALAFLICAAPYVAEADPIDTCIAAAEEGQRLRLDGELTFAREKLLACIAAAASEEGRYGMRDRRVPQPGRRQYAALPIELGTIDVARRGGSPFPCRVGDAA
jgi:hypothetical protein